MRRFGWLRASGGNSFAGTDGEGGVKAAFRRPETLDKALVGADILLLVFSKKGGKRTVHHQNVISAAKKNHR
jgi:uncharacterized protein YbjT (DUF2867 family)